MNTRCYITNSVIVVVVVVSIIIMNDPFTWLTESEAAHLLSGGERCDPLLLLLLCAVL